jgi:hypothetical protein
VTFEEILDLYEARRSGSQWVAKCPAHEDRTASLSITQENGKTLFHCHAECTTENVLAAKGKTFRDLYTSNGNGAAPTEKKIVKVYDYVDEQGVLRHQTVRYFPKSFSQRRPDGNGGWIWNLKGIDTVLYNLPEVLAAENVAIVEGEKDCESLRKIGIVATTSPMGAKNWKPEYAEYLRGKNLTLIPDQEKSGAGRGYSEAIATSAIDKTKSLALCNLPDGIKDVSDYLELFSPASLVELIKAAPPWRPGATEPTLGSLSTAELFAAQDVKVDWLAWPFAATGLTSILDALPKLGKTRFLLEGIHASLTKKPFLNLPTRPMRVIYISEQSGASLAMQAREVGFTGNEPVEELRWITREHWSRYCFTELLQHLEKDFLQNNAYDFLVWDCWHTIARLEDENAASEVNKLGNLTIDVAARHNMGSTFGRHDRKSGGDVGVSGRSSIQLSGLVDVILHLVRVVGKPTQRKLELLGRVPGLPNEQIIDLLNGAYINFGEPTSAAVDRVSQVTEWLEEEPALTGEQIVAKFAAMSPPVKISIATARRDKADATAKISRRRPDVSQP